ncbi:hypothetical protein EC973_005989, partial [Apophysomyces ossiformis]
NPKVITSANRIELPPQPTNQHPARKDLAEFVNIQQLLAGAEEDNRDVVFSGTDYGICTMSTTIRMNKSRHDECIKLYNRFAVLGSSNNDNEVPQVVQPTKKYMLSGHIW